MEPCVCIDRIANTEDVFHAAHRQVTRSLSHYPHSAEWFRKPLTQNPDTRLVALLGKKWQVGQTIRVYFYDGSAAVQAKVEAAAREWESYANIRFSFGADPNAEIRITCAAGGSSSEIGTNALLKPPHEGEPTMQLGWVEGASDSEVRRVTLHEFGHALGMLHEHSSPASGISWNLQTVYDWYYNKMGWTREVVDRNVIKKYSVVNTQFTAFDPNSIMVYPIDPSLTNDGYSVPMNSELSDVDKEWAGYFYPFPERIADLHLELLSLTCHETEDWFGADEPYLKLDGNVIWRCDSLNDGQTADLTPVAPIKLDRRVTIELFDQDAGGGDSDDCLGAIEVGPGDFSSQPVQRSFDLDEAYYVLTYRVTEEPTPVAFTPTYKSVIVANSNSGEIHQPGCRYIKQISSAHRIPAKGWGDADFVPALLAEGFDGCGACMPHLHRKTPKN